MINVSGAMTGQYQKLEYRGQWVIVTIAWMGLTNVHLEQRSALEYSAYVDEDHHTTTCVQAEATLAHIGRRLWLVVLHSAYEQQLPPPNPLLP